MSVIRSPLRSPIYSPVYDPLVGKWADEAAPTDVWFENVVLLMDSEQPGAGSDASIENVILIADGS